LKNDTINDPGRSTELAPLCFKWLAGSCYFVLYSLTRSPSFPADN